MGVLAKIAFRNVLKNRRRSVLVGFAVFVSTFLLLLGNAVSNGSEDGTLRSYRNVVAADVVAMWEEMKAADPNTPERLLDGFFETEKEAEKRAAVVRLRSFLEAHGGEVASAYFTVRRMAQIASPKRIDLVGVYGLAPENGDRLLRTGSVTIKTGSLLAREECGVCISEPMAKDHNLSVGSWVTIECATPWGSRNSLDFTVLGIYSGAAGWDAYYAYMSESDARVLFDLGPDLFDIGRIYLKDPDLSERFARELDAWLLAKSPVLRAESWHTACTFFTRAQDLQRSLYMVFVVFLLAIIGIGVRATVRMNLFQRMREFGTLRAIGFSRGQSFSVVFLEIFFLSILALSAASLLALVLVSIVGRTGIYVGSGPSSYSFGGEMLYPHMRLADVSFALVAVTLFSLLSPLGPGLDLSYQKISDILVGRMKRTRLVRSLLRSVVSRKSLRRVGTAG